MSGFGGGGMGNTIQDLIAQMQQNQQGGDATTPPAAPAAPGTGPGEPNNMNYGQMGNYNTLTQDMSRNMMGGWNFNNNMFGYSPYGNPYAQQQQPMGGFPSPGGMPPPGIQPGLGGGGAGRPPRQRDVMGGYGSGYGGFMGGTMGGYGGGGYGGGWGGIDHRYMH